MPGPDDDGRDEAGAYHRAPPPTDPPPRLTGPPWPRPVVLDPATKAAARRALARARRALETTDRDTMSTTDTEDNHRP